MSTYYHPEDLGPDQDQRDIAIPGRRFFVYVLDTDSGHYVGHTARLNARMREHRGGEVASTAGTNPMLAWQSGPMARRGDAARFEAALKSWLDSGSSMFEETTRLRPKKFLGLTPVLQSGTVRGVPSGAGRRFKLGADHRLRPTTAIGWLMFVAGIFGSLLGLLWAFNFELGALGVGALKVFGLAGACALGLVLVVNGRVLGRWPRLHGWLKAFIRRPTITGTIAGATVGLLWTFGFDLGALGLGIFKVAGLAAACALGVAYVMVYLSSERNPTRRRTRRSRRRSRSWR